MSLDFLALLPLGGVSCHTNQITKTIGGIVMLTLSQVPFNAVAAQVVSQSVDLTTTPARVA
jgi:hypothetical protein